MDNKEEKEFRRELFTIFVSVVVISIAIPGIYFWKFGGELSNKQNIWAEFGSFVGGTVTPVVSLFAFLALLITILIQSRTLKVSQQELALTREELAKTRKSAEMQAHHFKAESTIGDIIASISQIENTIDNLKNGCVPVYDSRLGKPVGGKLSVFLGRELRTVVFWSASSEDLVDNVELMQEEIGKVFELLFEQIMLLKEIPEAKNRYRVIIHKHLETIFLMSKVAAIPFEWQGRLDDESKEWLKLYEQRFRKNEIDAKRILSNMHGTDF